MKQAPVGWYGLQALTRHPKTVTLQAPFGCLIQAYFAVAFTGDFGAPEIRHEADML